MYDVVALGELLIDFSPIGNSDKGNVIFECNPGGAPANVLAALAKLGKNTSFIGKVGDDQFGLFLKSVLDGSEINTDGLVFSKDINTTLAFVHLDNQGDRSFSFYRKPGADMSLNIEEVDLKLIENCRIFHFGSISMTDEPSKGATIKAVEFAKTLGKSISFDPNLRPSLWRNLNIAKETIEEGLKYADILKLSEEELEFLTGTEDLIEGTEIIRNKYDIALIFITLGSEGCFYRIDDYVGKVDGYKVNAIDTTGAGDGFFGGILYSILEIKKDLKEIKHEEIEKAIKFANALGGLVTTKIGGIPAMPELNEIEQLINKG